LLITGREGPGVKSGPPRLHVVLGWGVVRNFTWGGKASNARTKVKWDTLALPTTKGGHRSQDPIGSPTSKAFDQGPGPKGRTLEGALEAQG
jgi:hypothetical protein